MFADADGDMAQLTCTAPHCQRLLIFRRGASVVECGACRCINDASQVRCSPSCLAVVGGRVWGVRVHWRCKSGAVQPLPLGTLAVFQDAHRSISHRLHHLKPISSFECKKIWMIVNASGNVASSEAELRT